MTMYTIHIEAPKTRHSLFVWAFSSHSRIFQSSGDVTIADEGLQILTYARFSWLLSHEGCLPCHTFFDTGIRLKWSSPRTRDTNLIGERLAVELSNLFLRLRSVAFGFEHLTFRLRGERSSPLRHRRGFWQSNYGTKYTIGYQHVYNTNK